MQGSICMQHSLYINTFLRFMNDIGPHNCGWVDGIHVENVPRASIAYKTLINQFFALLRKIGPMGILHVLICMQKLQLFCGLSTCYCFFKQVGVTKLAIKCAFFRFKCWKSVQIKACNKAFILHFFSLELDSWVKSYDILNGHTSHSTKTITHTTAI